LFYLDDPLFPYNSSSNSTVNVKQQHPMEAKSYANLLFDDGNLSSTTNFINEQRQPMLLIDERDLNC
jgi:hypothetical protein